MVPRKVIEKAILEKYQGCRSPQVKKITMALHIKTVAWSPLFKGL